MNDDLRKRSEYLNKQTPEVQKRIKEITESLSNISEFEHIHNKRKEFEVSLCTGSIEPDYSKIENDPVVLIYSKPERRSKAEKYFLSEDSTDIENFTCSCLGEPWTVKNLGINPNINYPDRTNSKKKKISLKNIINKAVKWWQN